MECPICGRNICLSVFSPENPLNHLEQHHSYCPVVDRAFPLWKESIKAVSEAEKNTDGKVGSDKA